MTARLVVLATGSGSNLQAILDATTDGRLDAEVVLVVVNRRSAYAAERAEAAGVPAVFRPMGPFRTAHPDDPRRAREAYDAALAAGEGAITVDGIMVDVPVADRARAVLAFADAIAARNA